jgi:hypothetical protein
MNRKPIIVTLTSIPPRFENLVRKLESIGRQHQKPDHVELYIPKAYRRFPGVVPRLPKLPSWVEVIRVADDFGPATKVLPAAEKWRSSEVDLLLCDDDRLQDPGWVGRFRTAREENAVDIICERGWNVAERFGIERRELDEPRARLAANRGRTASYRLKRLVSLSMWHPPRKVYECSGYSDVFEGFLGALVPSVAFHKDAWTLPDIVWTVDDVWLSGMARANGYRVWVNGAARPVYSDGKFDKVAALRDHVEHGVNREGADRQCVDLLRSKYKVWL